MKIHEYQAKSLLAKYGVPVPRGKVAFSVDEAVSAAKELGVGVDGKGVVIKAQIHAGGRGKGGGVKVAMDMAAAETHIKAILGMTLVTHQTGPEGRVVKRVLVEETLPIERELYLGITLDRQTGKNVFMASSEGGMDIEEVAAKTPELLLKETIEPGIGFQSFQARKLAFRMGIPVPSINAAVAAMMALSKAYDELDCSLAEVNPLILTKDGHVVALDCKMGIDDNAMFRHKDFAELRDLSEENEFEVRAGKAGLSYVKLDGNIGCLVNGAGLAMSTMDLIKLHGGEPANFLDVGGGANVQQVTEAFSIILADKNVQAVLVNIFGGIMKCDTIVTALLSAYDTVGFTVPLVVRLEGTNVEIARKMLADSGRKIIAATDLTDAAQKVVATLKA